jgi:hypothetical protein
MKTLFAKIILITIIISFVAGKTNGQDAKPAIPVPVQNLKKFIGRWEAVASLTMEGKTYKGPYWVDCKMTADGNGIYADEGFSNPEMGTMKGSNLAGFDPIDSKIKWFSVDNMGTAHEHTGDWKSPDHLYIEYYGIHDGKKYVEAIDFVFKNDKELDFKLVSTLDGVETERGEGIFHKK